MPTSSVHFAAQASPQRLAQRLQHDFVERLVARLQVGLGGLHQLELAGRSDRAGAPCRWCRRTPSSVSASTDFQDLSSSALNLLLEERLGVRRQLVPGVDVDHPDADGEADRQTEQRVRHLGPLRLVGRAWCR